MNLRAIVSMRQEFPDIVIGLSDHQHGLAMAVAAYALGALIFEKHFTHDHTARGTDHAFSLEPTAMAQYIKDIHRAARAMGDGVKQGLDAEAGALRKMAKSPYASRALAAGVVLGPSDIIAQSPFVGTPAWQMEGLVGRRLKTRKEAGELIAPDDTE
jgi:N-acetylneuraminate synthase/sialic acid synthase